MIGHCVGCRNHEKWGGSLAPAASGDPPSPAKDSSPRPSHHPHLYIIPHPSPFVRPCFSIPATRSSVQKLSELPRSGTRCLSHHLPRPGLPVRSGCCFHSTIS